MSSPVRPETEQQLPTSLDSKRWHYLRSILAQPGPFTSPHAVVGKESFDAVTESKILVIGAGGLGCEMLKDLALSGFKDIHVIDMDTIDISNLNRQFLFRESDVGKFKADVAAAFVMDRVPGVTITPHACKIQDFGPDFYRQFAVIMCGLDNMEARRWINSLVVGLVEPGDYSTIKPLIDGGTEGFGGQAKVIIPTITSCIECHTDMYARRPEVPLCTIASIPRQPEHCIEWAQIIAWPQERGDEVLDTDNPDHILWIYTKARDRALEHNISGVTYSVTQGVVKNIVPAVASTNAIIAAACCNEALKIVTAINPCLGNLDDGSDESSLHNPIGDDSGDTEGSREENAPRSKAPTYMMYLGDQGTYSYTFRPEKKADCPVCGWLWSDLPCKPVTTLQELIGLLSQHEKNIDPTSLVTSEKPLYYKKPTSLEEQTRPNLKRALGELLDDGDELAVTDSRLRVTYKFRVRFRS